MDEIGKIGEINSINDLLDFKLSLKTIAVVGFLGGSFWLVVIVFMLGGVSNTMEIISSFFDAAKNTVTNVRDKNIPQNVAAEKKE
jgi:hypothetical protein